MTYDTELTPPAPAESPVTAEQAPATAGRAAEQPPVSPERAAGAAPAANRPLFPEGDQEQLALRLRDAVTEFVESPLRAVGEAESAFDAAVDGLVSALRERRSEMNAQRQGEESETRTEELRITLQQYRDLTERLLNV
ncbi:hypothetical protein [Streptomyces sp. NPDC048669]|uniref:hypothetical protein n=1 Tax=Streptomyces sp. NPDC048669 TaxID=3155267 RepID=UPI00341AE727